MGKSEKKLAVWLEMGINETGVTEKCIENWSTWQETWVELSSNGKLFFIFIIYRQILTTICTLCKVPENNDIDSGAT